MASKILSELRSAVEKVENELAPSLKKALAAVRADEALVSDEVRTALASVDAKAKTAVAAAEPEVKADADKVAELVVSVVVKEVEGILASHSL